MTGAALKIPNPDPSSREEVDQSVLPALEPLTNTKWLRYLNYAAATMVGIFIFVLNYNAIQSNDTWWHLELGRYISESGSFIYNDVYSATLKGRNFVAYEWLSEWLFYQVADFNAQNLTYMKLALMVLGGIAFLRTMLKSYQVGPAVAVILVALCYLVAFRAHLRPQLFGICFVATYVSLITQWRTNPQRKYLWPLVPLQVFWANMHGSFLLAPVLTSALVALLWLEDRMGPSSGWHKDPINRSERIYFSFLPLWLVLASLINPYHYHLFEQTLGIFFHSGYMREYIKEWNSITNLSRMEYWAVTWVIWMVAAWIITLADRSKRSLLDFGLLALATYLPLSAMRHVAISALISFPIMLRHLHQVRPQSAHPRFVILLLVFPILYVANNGNPYSAEEHKPLGAGFHYAQIPLATLQYLKKSNATGIIMNHYTDGGYIMYYLSPQLKQVMDSRTDLYGEDLYKEHYEAYFSDVAFMRYLVKYDVDYVLINLLSNYDVLRAALIKDSDWQLEMVDNKRALFHRVQATQRPPISPGLPPVP